MVKLQSITINIKGSNYLVVPMDGYLSAQRMHDIAIELGYPELPENQEMKEPEKWNAKTVGRRTTAKLAPYGLRKDGSPAKKRGRPAK